MIIMILFVDFLVNPSDNIPSHTKRKKQHMFTANARLLQAQNTLDTIVSGLTSTFQIAVKHRSAENVTLCPESARGRTFSVSVNRPKDAPINLSLSISLSCLDQDAYRNLFGFDSGRGPGWDIYNQLEAKKPFFDNDAKKAALKAIVAKKKDAIRQSLDTHYGKHASKVSFRLKVDHDVCLSFDVTEIEEDAILAAHISEILQWCRMVPRPTTRRAVGF
jgi:hypothetical protein